MSLSTAEASKDLLTFKDYLTFPDNDRIKKEIIDGELFMSPSPSVKHQTIVRNIFFILYNFVRQEKRGEVFFAPCDVIFSDFNVLQPDIIFISNSNLQILTELNIKGAPDLLVEIISPSSADTDRIFKKRIYERFGVKEYWIVDPKDEIIEIWLLKNSKYELFVKAEKKRKIQSALLNGLEIDSNDIF